MDANRLRFHLLSDAPDWVPEVSVVAQRVAVYDAARKTLRLGSLTDPLALDEETDPLLVSPRLATAPAAQDAYGTWAWWDASAKQVRAGGGGAGTTLLFDPATVGLPAGAVTDLAPGADGILYAAVGQRVAAVHLRQHWAPRLFPAAGLSAWRLAADPRGGAYLLSGPPAFGQQNAPPVKLGRVDGEPLPDVLPIPDGADLFRPTEENPDAPRTRALATLSWPGEVPVGLCCAPSGKLAVLSWVVDGVAAGVGAGQPWARVRIYTDRFSAPLPLAGLKAPFSLRFLEEGRLVVLSLMKSGRTEAIAYDLDDVALTAVPRGDYFPLPGHDGGPLWSVALLPPALAGETLPPHHGQVGGPVLGPVPLQALSLPQLALQGRATNPPTRPFDSGDARTTWHRLYLEGVLPPRCGVRVWLAATDLPLAPAPAAPDWHEHRFGALPPAVAPGAPDGVWVPLPSEVPFAPSLSPAALAPGESGLFTALIQRANRRVRSLTGRYLWLRLELYGDGRRTPEVAALRAYASRFSYAQNYLPALYREDRFGADADAEGGATQADFLERFLGIVEGVFTPIEDRIVAAHALTDARTVPDGSLEWLAGWVGLTFDPLIPVERRRAMLRASSKLARGRGTLGGLRLALDVVTDGAVARGEVVVVEDFRLRRTFATLLGADLSDSDDALMPGLAQSGNSYVGDTLFLGDATQKEFLALFGDSAIKTAAEDAAVDQFLAKLAYRVTVLVHQNADAERLGLLRRVAELEVPAHVQVAITTASTPLLVGLASLVGADTFVGPQPELQPVRLGQSVLGLQDVIERPPSLDPRLEGG